MEHVRERPRWAENKFQVRFFGPFRSHYTPRTLFDLFNVVSVHISRYWPSKREGWWKVRSFEFYLSIFAWRRLKYQTFQLGLGLGYCPWFYFSIPYLFDLRVDFDPEYERYTD